jgi:hypothetical protein
MVIAPWCLKFFIPMPKFGVLIQIEGKLIYPFTYAVLVLLYGPKSKGPTFYR